MNYKLTNYLDRSSSYWKHVKAFEHKNTDNQKLYLITSSVHGYEVLVEMRSLDKTKFYVVGAGIFTGLTVALYPISVVKTRMQVATKESFEKSAYDVIRGLLKTEGVPVLYRGFGTVITGAVPARIIFLTALESTKVAAFKMVEPFKLSDPTKAAIANGLVGMTAYLFSQGVFVPIDVNGYNKDKITSLVVRGCTKITASMLEEVLGLLPCLSSVEIRGCSQFEDLASKFSNIIWVKSRTSHSAMRNKQLAKSSHVEDSSGLRDYFVSLDKRDVLTNHYVMNHRVCAI